MRTVCTLKVTHQFANVLSLKSGKAELSHWDNCHLGCCVRFGFLIHIQLYIQQMGMVLTGENTRWVLENWFHSKWSLIPVIITNLLLLFTNYFSLLSVYIEKENPYESLVQAFMHGRDTNCFCMSKELDDFPCFFAKEKHWCCISLGWAVFEVLFSRKSSMRKHLCIAWLVIVFLFLFFCWSYLLLLKIIFLTFLFSAKCHVLHRAVDCGFLPCCCVNHPISCTDFCSWHFHSE